MCKNLANEISEDKKQELLKDSEGEIGLILDDDLSDFEDNEEN